MTAGRGNPSRRKTDAEKADQLTRCWELRRDGYSERDIVKATGIPLSTVHRRLVEAFDGYVSPEREKVRAWEDDRLDLVIRTAVEVARSAEDPEVRLKALDRIMKASERRSALHGADEPTRSVVSTDNTFRSADPELDALLANLAADTEATIAMLNEHTTETGGRGGSEDQEADADEVG